MKKLLTRTPLISLLVFLLFLLVYEALTNNYKIDTFNTYETKVVNINMNTGVVEIEKNLSQEVKVGNVMHLVYSSQEQVLKGKIITVTDETVAVYFNKLQKIDEAKVNSAGFEVMGSKQPIGGVLKLWN